MRYWILILMLCGTCFASLAPWPVQPEYYGVLGHWRFNDHQVAGAVAQYKLDDEAANTVVDNNLGTDATWGHGNTDQHDAASWCTAFGQSLEFDGSNDYIDTNQTFETVFQSSFSISMWVQPHDGQPDEDQILCGVADGTGDFDGAPYSAVSAILFTSGHLFVLYMSGYENSNSVMAEAMTVSPVFIDGENNWHHLVFVVPDTGSIAIYVDGVESVLDSEYNSETSDLVFGDFASTNNFYFGAANYYGGYACLFDGRMDNVAIYDRALTAEDVAWLATCGTQNTESSMYTVEGSDADGKDLTAAVSISNVAEPDGQITGCFDFDGTNDYLYRADDSTYDFDGDDDFSISIWIKRPSTDAAKYIVSKKSAAGYVLFTTSGYNGGLGFVRYDQGGTNYEDTYTINKDVQDDNWHHVVAVRTAGSTAKIYVDGVDCTYSVGNSAESYDLQTAGGLYVGCTNSYGYKWDGSLDDLMIFNRALTAAEVEALYERGIASMEVSSPYTDWRFWEDARRGLWAIRWSRGSGADEATFPALAEFQSGGEHEDDEYAVGDLFLVCDGNLYVNEVAKDEYPLSGSLDPSTDSNWSLCANPISYHQWDKLQDRYAYDRYTATWHKGCEWLPTQMDPYAQSLGTQYLGSVQLPSPSSVSLTDAIIQDYVDKFEEYYNWCGYIYAYCGPTDTFADWWEEVLGESFDADTHGYLFLADSVFFGSNCSALDLVLQLTGEFSYKWYLDTNHPADFEGCEYDYDWLAFHPKYYDWFAEEWVPWNEETDGYIQAVWRRVPLFKEVVYDHAESDQPMMWMGDASQEPPGLEGKEFWDRCIRCTLATKDTTRDVVPDTNSLTLAQVQSAYASQYGYWDDGEEEWVNGSVTYKGSQMYTAIEACSDAAYTDQEIVGVGTMLGGVAYATDENGENGQYVANGSFMGSMTGQTHALISNATSGSVGVSTSIIDLFYTPSEKVTALHCSGTCTPVQAELTDLWSNIITTYILYNLRWEDDPAIEYNSENPYVPGWSHYTYSGCQDYISTGTIWQLWENISYRICNNYMWGNTVRASALGRWFPYNAEFKDKYGAPFTHLGFWYGLVYKKNETPIGCEHAPYQLEYKIGHTGKTIEESFTVLPCGNIPDVFIIPVWAPNLSFFPQWQDEFHNCEYTGTTFPYTIFSCGHSMKSFSSTIPDPVDNGSYGARYSSATKVGGGPLYDGKYHITFDRPAEIGLDPVYSEGNLPLWMMTGR